MTSEAAKQKEQPAAQAPPAAAAHPQPAPAQSPAQEAYALVRLDPQALIEQAINKDASMETLERLFALAEKVQERQAKAAWLAAMAQFGERCPRIIKSETAQIRSARGNFDYSYAPLGAILSVINPVLGPLGLSVSFRVRHEAEKVISNCRISHELGHHEESGEIAVPVGTEAMGATAAQRIGIASTYAKRYALMAILGLAPEDDPDATDAAPRAPAVEMPRRNGDPAPAPASQDPGTWTGIAKIAPGALKSGTRKDGSKWTVWNIVGTDGSKFSTFDQAVADFVKESGGSRVAITYVQDGEYRKITGIEPAFEADEPRG